MNILWITNIQFPAVRGRLGLPVEVVGGWMFALASELSFNKQVNMAVSTIYDGVDLKRFVDSDIVYYLLPAGEMKKYYDRSLEKYWVEVINEFKPDIIHIHGTEYAHGLACVKACPKQKYVISIQGLLSVYQEYYYAGIKPFQLIKHTTLNDIKNFMTTSQVLKELRRRTAGEMLYLSLCTNIIGRTSWDYSHVMAINPGIKYYFCNEVLRDSFYNSDKWRIDLKKDFTIFISQASSPRKGLHQVIKALSIVKNYFPDVQLRVAGVDITGGRKWAHRTVTYGAYIRSLLSTHRLHDKVVFLGKLDETDMARELRSAHIHVCASVIENSPNSLGEAQLIGTPSIASFVGGVPDMVKDRETGLLYRFDDHVLLAYKIIELFNDDELARNISKNGILVASERHNKTTIVSRMLEIYQTIQKG